jgi:hypothetical protein
MTSLYIYYRVRAENAARLGPMVRAMQAGFGTGTVMRRPGEKDGLQTWMEVYPDAGSDFAAQLDASVAESGMLALIEGPRHTEAFVELPCA